MQRQLVKAPVGPIIPERGGCFAHLKGYGYLKAMWNNAKEREARLKEIEGREAQAYYRIYGYDSDHWRDHRWYNDPEAEKFRDEKSAVDSWFIR